MALNHPTKISQTCVHPANGPGLRVAPSLGTYSPCAVLIYSTLTAQGSRLIGKVHDSGSATATRQNVSLERWESSK